MTGAQPGSAAIAHNVRVQKSPLRIHLFLSRACLMLRRISSGGLDWTGEG
jgi:hypothetical protein